MHPERNTGSDDAGEVGVHDAREPRFGLSFLSDIDTDDYRSLSPKAVRVYQILTMFASKESRTAYPTQRRIAKIAGLNRDTVNKAIRQLCEKDFVRKETTPSRTTYTLISHPKSDG